MAYSSRFQESAAIELERIVATLASYSEQAASALLDHL